MTDENRCVVGGQWAHGDHAGELAAARCPEPMMESVPTPDRPSWVSAVLRSRSPPGARSLRPSSRCGRGPSAHPAGAAPSPPRPLGGRGGAHRHDLGRGRPHRGRQRPSGPGLPAASIPGRGSPSALGDGTGYRLEVASAQVDMHVFEELTARDGAELAAGWVAEAERVLSEALGPWRGPALPDLTSRGPAEDLGLDPSPRSRRPISICCAGNSPRVHGRRPRLRRLPVPSGGRDGIGSRGAPGPAGPGGGGARSRWDREREPPRAHLLPDRCFRAVQTPGFSRGEEVESGDSAMPWPNSWTSTWPPIWNGVCGCSKKGSI